MSSCSLSVLACALIGMASAALFAPPARAASESVIYAFGARTGDGVNPVFGLAKAGKNFYGTTYFGGAYGNGNAVGGTFFKVTASGGEKVLHSFGSAADGNLAGSNLTQVNGEFYGVTGFGGTGCSGSGGCGTVFSVTTTGSEAVSYSFQGGNDGNSPNSLIDVNGTLYGTTSYGGGSGCGGTGCGTFFSVTPAGVEQVLYAFAGGNDGAYPASNLINVGGVLYGTTSGGGASGCGTVFKVTPTGKEKVLHAFTYSDGCTAFAGLTQLGGLLYGTTVNGGGGAACTYGCGVLYKMTKAGELTDLYAFQAGNDGAYPQAGLTNVGGILYGVTANGGGTGCGGFGCGTIFSLTEAGATTVLYAFQGGADGYLPLQGYLLNDNGTLYGTTYEGGGTGCGGTGCGTVFTFKP